jgi:nucleotidyltransferase substrate binding protein (TIGR01987 family)
MNQKQLRWKQRYINLNKAYKQLSEAVNRYPNLSDLEKEGLIQRFEYTFELAWKTLKDYLESKGVVVAFPRDVIKEAFSSQIIREGEVWIDMLDNRNMMAYTYEESVFNEVVAKINESYFLAIEQLMNFFEQEQ